MIRALFIILFFCVFSPLQLHAEPLTFDLVQDHVEITSSFSGMPLVVFGSVNAKGDLAVILEGPVKNSTVRRKERIMGAWINRGWARFEGVPSYYDFAMNVEEGAPPLLRDDIALEKHLGFAFLNEAVHGKRHKGEALQAFRAALLRNKQERDLYPLASQNIQFISPELFRVDFDLPSNIPSGQYKVRVMLIRGGGVVYEQVKEFSIGLEGVSANIYKFAQGYSFLYGVLCVFIACIFGWLSGVIVRRN